tara:strand:- start:875 stop:1003 length:129 start_codon:yes stop_codon:yes gene_type:complete
MIYTIIKDGIVIGRFQEKEDRDKAFEQYVLPYSQNCLTGYEE